MKYRNTLKRGSVRHIIFKEENTWYGVALELNIVEEGDNPIEVMASLFEAMRGYIETARKFKLRLMPLNQKSDKEYEELWDRLQEKKEPTKPQEVFNFGYTPFESAALVR